MAANNTTPTGTDKFATKKSGENVWKWLSLTNLKTFVLNGIASFPGFGTTNVTAAYGDHTHAADANKKDATYKGWYDTEKVMPLTSGTLTLKNATETYNGAYTNANTFTVALPAPVVGQVNESILIFKIGATLPAITQPSGIVYRGIAPTLTINSSWTFVYEQVNTTSSTFEIWCTAVKNA